MKKILYQNESAINSDLTKIVEAQRNIKLFVDAYSTMNLPIKLASIEDLVNSVNGPESWVKEKLAEEISVQKIWGMPIKKDVAVDLIELPDFIQLSALADMCKPFLHYLPYMSFNGKDLSLKSDYKSVISEQHTVFTQNSEQEKLIATHQAAAKALSAFNESIKNAGADRLNPDLPIGHYFKVGYSNTHSFGSGSLDVELNENFYLRLLKQLVK